MKSTIAILAAAGLLVQAASASAQPALYFGADMSFVNEMEDCGGVWREKGARADPYALIKRHGGNLARIRIWNDPDWTRYSNLADVRKSIRRARAEGLQVLLDFHYSDTWADGDKQIIPKAWEPFENDPGRLATALHDFTFETLKALDAEGLMPELVQVGNEINLSLLGREAWGHRPIDWTRNAMLLNAGIAAVREAGAASAIKPRVMLHIAQPENVEPWFRDATAAGVTDFDQIGLSYYGKWSKYDLAGLGEVIKRLTVSHAGKEVILVETAYPWTLDYADELPNVLGEDSLIAGYPATPQGQQRYMADVTRAVLRNGGVGVVYWEPAWISTNCKTPWGRGSSWENATFFDFRHKNELLPAIDFMRVRP